MFSGSTKVQKRKFMDQYEAYRREIALANASRSGGTQIHQVPLSACIDPLAVERIAFWEIGKAGHWLTEADWREYFLGAREGDPLDMAKLDAAMTKLKMDASIGLAESCVSKLVSNFQVILVRLSMEGFAESEPKLTVDYRIAAVQPQVVQKRVKELMKLNENRAYKKDACAFKAWLANYMRRYGEFEQLVAPAAARSVREGRPVVEDKVTDKLAARAEKARLAKVERDEANVVAVVDVDKVPEGNFTQEKRACFKCLKVDHNVFQCPKVVEGEAAALMAHARLVWAKQKPKAVTVAHRLVDVTTSLAIGGKARVVCVIAADVHLDASFDSGADQAVIPPKMLDRLRAAGKDVVVNDLQESARVKGFMGPAHTVTQEAIVDLRFETSAGPLVFRNVSCWVSHGDLPKGWETFC